MCVCEENSPHHCSYKIRPFKLPCIFNMRETIKTNCYMDKKTVLVRVQKVLSAWIEMKSAEKCG